MPLSTGTEMRLMKYLFTVGQRTDGRKSMDYHWPERSICSPWSWPWKPFQQCSLTWFLCANCQVLPPSKPTSRRAK